MANPVAPAPVLSCPTCGQATKQHRAGSNLTGTLRRECRHCGRTYTPWPKKQGYDLAVRRQALQMYVDGTNLRRIARHLSVNPQSVANWVNAAAANIPAPPTPRERRDEGAVEVLELDELYTFVSQKEGAYVVTCVERATRRILGWAVTYERDPDTMQSVVDAAPLARRYFSDGLNVYPALMYAPGIHAVAPGKSQTYSVEGDNAELRHYLARLARRSRCFSRCLWALARAVALFVYAWNRRQRFKRQFPKLPANVRDFVADLI